MNKNGQVLIIFVMLIPVLLIAIAYAVDTSLIMYHKNKLDNLNDLVVDYIVKDDLPADKIKELIIKNDSEVKLTELILDDEIRLELAKEVNSLFGNIIGKDKYLITSNKKVNR